MADLFISYRRDDSLDITGRIYDWLAKTYDSKHIFIDIESIPGGQWFPARLESAIDEHTVMIVIIGQQWLALTQTRQQAPDDFARIEIEIALRHRATIIPVLVHGASMPRREELPLSIADLASHNAINIRSGADFTHDMQMLVSALPPKEALSSSASSSRRSEFPTRFVVASISVVLIAALATGLIWNFTLRPKQIVGPVPTATIPPPCIDSSGEDTNSLFTPNPLNDQPPRAQKTEGIGGQVIRLIESGDMLNILATTRIGFDVGFQGPNGICMPINWTGGIKGLDEFTANSPNTLLATDFSLSEVDTLDETGIKSDDSLTLNRPDPQQDGNLSIPLGVIPEIMVVNSALSNRIPSLTTAQIKGIYQGQYTNWDQLGGPDLAITAVLSGNSNTTAKAWPTDQADQEAISGPFVAFKRNILNSEAASGKLDLQIGQSNILKEVLNHPGGIGYISLTAWIFYNTNPQVCNCTKNVHAQVQPLAINNISPASYLSPGFSLTPSQGDLLGGQLISNYPFWDIAHVYVKTSQTITSPSGKTLLALEQYLLNEHPQDVGLPQYAFQGLGWVPLSDFPLNTLQSHDQRTPR